MMRQIYENAAATIVWLGKSWDGLPFAIGAIKKLAAAEPAGRMAALTNLSSSKTSSLEAPEGADLPTKRSQELREFGRLL
jgi:hypothetical protein